MTKLVSKLQYNNFETGEFAEEIEHSYEETIALIKAFPWVAQRNHLHVSLTNPSITLQSADNSFLKLAVFFNNTFVLHYFNAAGELFTKSFTSLPDAYPYIQNYFSSTTFNTTGFRKENTWLQHNRKHFVSQDFHYQITPQRIRQYLWQTSAMNFGFGIVLAIGLFYSGGIFLSFVPFMFLIFFFFFVGGGVNLVLLFNYYRYAKNKVLIMSKGNDIFYYGDKDSLVKYSKKDILQFTIVKFGNARHTASQFSFTIIDFTDVSTIKIPNFIINDSAVRDKLAGGFLVEKNSFPYIKS